MTLSDHNLRRGGTQVAPSRADQNKTAGLRRTACLELIVGMILLLCLALSAQGAFGLSRVFIAQSLIVYAIIAVLVVWKLPLHLPNRQFGAANRVTLLRAVLVALLAGAIGQGALAPTALWALTGAAAVAAALDGLDGWTARRRDLCSPFGERFDWELDAFFILVLATLAFDQGKAGVWVLASGALRYLFVLAGRIVPRLRAPLPPSRRRQVICVIQILILVVVLAPVIAPTIAALLAALGLGLLAGSFACDLIWLLRSDPGKPHKPW